MSTKSGDFDWMAPRWTIPEGAKVSPSVPFRTYFFSPKKGPPPADFSGTICSLNFGIRDGETVMLYAKNGDKLDQRMAR